MTFQVILNDIAVNFEVCSSLFHIFFFFFLDDDDDDGDVDDDFFWGSFQFPFWRNKFLHNDTLRGQSQWTSETTLTSDVYATTSRGVSLRRAWNFGLDDTWMMRNHNDRFGRSRKNRIILCCTVSNLSRIDFYKTDHLVGAKLFWGSYRL